MAQMGGAYRHLAQPHAQENGIRRWHQEPVLATSSSELGDLWSEVLPLDRLSVGRRGQAASGEAVFSGTHG